jgi:hypothetical protein
MRQRCGIDEMHSRDSGGAHRRCALAPLHRDGAPAWVSLRRAPGRGAPAHPANEDKVCEDGGVNIAYQVVGYGPVDLVMVPGWTSNVEGWWELPASTAFYERLATFCRLIIFDKRGTGMSDPFPIDEPPTL